MGTRGSLGVKKNGKYFFMYNHFDSYPDGLGVEVVEFVKGLSEDNLNLLGDRIEKLQVVKCEGTPTEEEKEYYKESHQEVSTGKDWYSYLRDFQGVKGLQAILSGKMKHFILEKEFILDSLFCEYAYILDIDEGILEFYKGFQKEPQEGNPFGIEMKESGYYPCKRVGKCAYNNIPENWMEKFYPEED